MQVVLDLIWKHLLPGMSEQPSPLDDGQYGELHDVIGSLGYAPLTSEFAATAAESITGNRYILDDNELKLKSASFRFEGDECTFDFQIDRGEEQVRFGIGRWMESTTTKFRGMSIVAASGMWLDAKTFIMEWRFVETPFKYTLTCRFEEASVKIEVINHIGGSNEPLNLNGRLG